MNLQAVFPDIPNQKSGLLSLASPDPKAPYG